MGYEYMYVKPSLDISASKVLKTACYLDPTNKCQLNSNRFVRQSVCPSSFVDTISTK